MAILKNDLGHTLKTNTSNYRSTSKKPCHIKVNHCSIRSHFCDIHSTLCLNRNFGYICHCIDGHVPNKNDPKMCLHENYGRLKQLGPQIFIFVSLVVITLGFVVWVGYRMRKRNYFRRVMTRNEISTISVQAEHDQSSNSEKSSTQWPFFRTFF